MSSDLDAIIHRVKQTAASLDPDSWMEAVAPRASETEKKALREKLAAVPRTDMRRDAARIRALQADLKTRGLKGFVVPRADEHMGEYLLPGNERLHWLTGFTGSAGMAVVLDDKAALFIDGRYTIQGPAEVEASVITCRHILQPPPQTWVASEVQAGDVIGYDPDTFALKDVAIWEKALAAKGATLQAVSPNPIDALWHDRPADPFAAIRPHPDSYAGQSSEQKRTLISMALKTVGMDAVIINQLDSICWLLNMRGGDTPNTPLIQGYVLLHNDGHATWFVDSAKFTQGVREALGNQVSIRPVGEFSKALAEMKGREVMLDAETAPASIDQRLKAAGAKIGYAADPCIALKAAKNAVEQEGTRRAHIRDGAAMVNFLCWLDGVAGSGTITERDVQEKLETFRRAAPEYRGKSFGSISAAGPNAALPHYRSTPESNRTLESRTLYLIDSGGQYVDGTTDITRTIAVGALPAEFKKHFTLVLKGHIALSTMRFPRGTVGKQLDALARQFLWREGLDYDHGTGHGVGSYLGVHETAARIAKASDAELKEGMLLSNEPGFYKESSHGIRIENLLFVTDAGNGFLAFEDVTLCPIDKRAIETALLTEAERDWLNAYHARVWDMIGPLVEGGVKAWLKQATDAV